MTKIWTLVTGGYDVAVYTDKAALDAAIVDAIKGYKDNPEDFEADELEQMRQDNPDDPALIEVTIDNWKEALAALNREMDAMGEGHYLCDVKEHEMAPPRAAIILNEDGVVSIDSTSSLLAGAEVAVIRTGFSPDDYSSDDIMQIDRGRGAQDHVGHVETVVQASWDVGAAYEAIAAKPDGSAPRR